MFIYYLLIILLFIVMLLYSTLEVVNSQTLSAEAKSSVTPRKVLLFNGYEYIVVGQVKTWDQHNQLAAERGGHLASVKDDRELEFILKNVFTIPSVARIF